MKIRFISNNKHKFKEAQEILKSTGVSIHPILLKINELQTENAEHLLKDKALKAYKVISRPLFVEHTCLYLKHLPNLPGGLTQLFWDNLKADRFAEIFGKTADPSVVAKTFIGYIDGKRFHQFQGEISGTVASEPSGNRDFQWDCVFIPDGFKETFADLGPKKNEISMRRKALDHFAEFLKRQGHA
ncbi:MAG: non-canonical purine NTP pyrophosphatase [Nitrospinae bacterium]|nr:non-canonical purine NTP pyrophosphatase [Nitrospinota bacterium]